MSSFLIVRFYGSGGRLARYLRRNYWVITVMYHAIKLLVLLYFGLSEYLHRIGDRLFDLSDFGGDFLLHFE